VEDTVTMAVVAVEAAVGTIETAVGAEAEDFVINPTTIDLEVLDKAVGIDSGLARTTKTPKPQ
jgi:hypothetical protein